MKILRFILVLSLLSASAFANQKFQGKCTASGLVVTSGLNSTNSVDLTYANATVTVTIVGGGLATLFSDNSGTPLANPFTANSDATFSFYAANGRYSATCTSPTITYSDILLFDSATNAVTCTNQFIFAVSSAGVYSCGTITGAATDSTIAKTGGDLSTANPAQVTHAHITGGTQNTLAKFDAVGNPVPSACTDNGATVTCTEPVNIGANPLTAGAGNFSGAVTAASLAATGAVSGASLAITGPITSKNIGNVRYTDQFSGADWSAKLCAADADLGATPGVIYVTTPTQGNATTNCSLSSNHHVFFFPGTFTCTGCSITIAPVGTKIEGSGLGATTLAQGSAGTNLIIGSSLTDVEISGITFSGVSGVGTGTTNFAIFLSNTVAGNISRAKVHDNAFTGWRGNSVYLQNAQDVEVYHNLCFATSGSCIRGSGVVRFKFLDNTVRDAAVTTFNIGIMIDSTDPILGTSYPVSTDGVISGNVLMNLPKWYSIELHSGQRIVVSGNQMNNVEDGVIVTPFNGTDTISDVVISGNSVVGTNTQDTNCGGGADFGISVAGGGVGIATPTNVSITGNEVSNANAALRVFSMGAINIGTVNNVNVVSNIVKGGYGTGISIQGTTNPANVVDVQSNQVSGVQVATNTGGYCGDGATAAGIYVTGPVAPIGKIDNNHIDNTLWGIRSDISSPNMLVSTSGNTFTGVTNNFIGPGLPFSFYGTQQFATATTCTTAAAAGATCTTAAITLPVGYADTNYRLSVMGQNTTNFPVIVTYTKSNSSFTITIEATTAAAASYGGYDIIATR